MSPVDFEPDERVDIVVFGVAVDDSITMLFDTAAQVVNGADMDPAEGSGGEDADVSEARDGSIEPYSSAPGNDPGQRGKGWRVIVLASTRSRAALEPYSFTTLSARVYSSVRAG